MGIALLAPHLDGEGAEGGGMGPVRAGHRATPPPCQLCLHVGDWRRELAGHVVAVDLDVARHGQLGAEGGRGRSEEHTSELQSLAYLVCRLLLEKKKKKKNKNHIVLEHE